MENRFEINFSKEFYEITEQYNSLMNTPPPKSEADKKSYIQCISSLEDRAEILYDIDKYNLFIINIISDLSFRRGDYKKSLNYFSKINDICLKFSNVSNLGMASNFSRMAKLDEAKYHINKVSDYGINEDLYLKEKRLIEFNSSILESINYAEDLINLIGQNKKDTHLHEEIIRKSLYNSNLPYYNNKNVEDLLIRSFKILSEIDIPNLESKDKWDILTNYKNLRRINIDKSSSRALFCSGFMWSGSGAITDFLSDSQEIHIAFNGRELTLFNYLNTLLGIFDSKCGEVSGRELVSIFMGPIAGLLVDKSRIMPRRNSSLFKAQWDAENNIDKQISVCHKFLDRISNLDIRSNENSHMRILEYLLIFSNEIIDSIIKNDKKYTVFNNCIFGFHAREMAIFENSLMISVRRDPRDQYVSQFYEMPPKDRPTIERFIKVNRSRLMHYNRTVKFLELSDKLIEVFFEDFVLKEETRDELVKNLGLSWEKFNIKKSFNPEASKKNVMIYKNFSNSSDIENIKKSLEDFLYI